MPILKQKRTRNVILLVLLLALSALTLTIVLAAGNSIASPDRAGDVGWYTSLALDSNGYPVVSYYDNTNGDLKLLHCNDPNCAGGDESITSPDTADAVGWFTSLALDSNGYPVISYYDLTNGNLKLLHCNDLNCAGDDESMTSPDTNGDVGWYTSLVLDSNGYPVVSYLDFTNFDLKLLHCNDPNCADGESITIPDSNGSVGGYTSLALDSNGYPVVSYFDYTNGDLKLLHCNDPNCAGGEETITTLDTNGSVGQYTSLALDSNGYPVVSYMNGGIGDLKLLHCNDPNCTGGDESITSPDTIGFVGYFTSLALDSNGYPIVSYSDSTNNDLKLLLCNDPNCAGGDESITSPDIIGLSTSLALDSNGYPVVSYLDFTKFDLKLLHCGSAKCNTPPTIDAGGPYSGLTYNPIPMSSAATRDLDGDPLTFSWGVDSSDCSISDPTILNPSLLCTSVGSFVVTLTVSDGQETVSDSAILTVITPQQGIIELKDNIQALQDGGVLSRSQANELKQPLNNALSSLNRGQITAACSYLQNFIDEVTAFIHNPLDPGRAADLIADADAIRSSIGCT